MGGLRKGVLLEVGQGLCKFVQACAGFVCKVCARLTFHNPLCKYNIVWGAVVDGECVVP